MTTKLLLGPGPSNAHPRVLKAMARPLLGHLDPEFLGILDEAQQHLAELFGVTSGLTVPISATGSAGMEACFVNMVQPGDKVLAGVNGVFGGRMAEVARRAGAEGDDGRGRVGHDHRSRSDDRQDRRDPASCRRPRTCRDFDRR